MELVASSPVIGHVMSAWPRPLRIARKTRRAAELGEEHLDADPLLVALTASKPLHEAQKDAFKVLMRKIHGNSKRSKGKGRGKGRGRVGGAVGKGRGRVGGVVGRRHDAEGGQDGDEGIGDGELSEEFMEDDVPGHEDCRSEGYNSWEEQGEEGHGADVAFPPHPDFLLPPPIGPPPPESVDGAEEHVETSPAEEHDGPPLVAKGRGRGRGRAPRAERVHCYTGGRGRVGHPRPDRVHCYWGPFKFVELWVEGTYIGMSVHCGQHPHSLKCKTNLTFGGGHIEQEETNALKKLKRWCVFGLSLDRDDPDARRQHVYDFLAGSFGSLLASCLASVPDGLLLDDWVELI